MPDNHNKSSERTVRHKGPWLLGRNDWGNLYRHVVHRRIRNLEGFVISDMGEMQAVADAEDGWPIVAPTAEWIGYGSPAHIDRDANA